MTDETPHKAERRRLGDVTRRYGEEWKYIPVRRFLAELEESLDRGTEWVVFQPEDEGIALVELADHAGNTLSYYQRRLEDEGYLDTSRRQGAGRVVALIAGFAAGWWTGRRS